MISRTTTFVKTKLSSREKRLLRQRLSEQDALVEQLRSGTIPELEQRARELEEQVAASARNAATVQQLGALLADQSALIGQLRDTIPLLQRRIAEQEREIRRREDALDSARAHVETLEKLRPQAAQSEVLLVRVAALQGENSKLQERLDTAQCKELEQAATIAGLTSELVPLRALPDALAERETRVADLERTLHLLEGEQYTANEEAKKHAETVDAQKAELRAHKDTVSTQRAELESLRPLVLKLEAASKDAAQRFAALEEQHAGATQALAAQTQAVAELEPLPKVVAQKDALIDDMEKRIAALDEQVAAKSAAATELEPLRAQMDDKLAQIDDLRTQLDKLTKETDASLAEKTSKLEALEKQLAEANSLAEQRADAVAQKATQLEALENQLAAANSLAEERVTTITQRDAALKEKEAAIADKEALIDSLRAGLYGLGDIEREKAQLEVQLTGTKEQLAAAQKLAEDHAATHALLVEKTARVEALEAEKLRLDEELATTKTQLAADDKGALLKELEADKQRLEGELTTLKAEAAAEDKTALVAQLEADKQRLEGALAASKVLSDEHASLRAQVDEKTALLTQLEVDKRRFEVELAALKAQPPADDKSALVATLEADKQRLEGELAALNAKTQTASDVDVEDRTAQLKTLEADKQRLESELAAAKALVDEHSSARAQLDEKTTLLGQIEADKQRLETALAESKTLADQLEPLRAQLAEKTALAEELGRLHVALRARVQELRDTAKARAAALDASTTTTLPKLEPDERLKKLIEFWESNDKLRSDSPAELVARQKTADELAALRALADEKDALVEDARGKAAALEKRIAELDSALNAGAEERNTLKTDLDEAQSELKARTVHADEQAGTIASLHAELESVRRVLVQMRAFVSQAARRMADLDQVHRRLQDELVAAKLAVGEKDAAITELRAQLAARDDALKALEEAKGALATELEPLRPLPALAADWGALIDDQRKQLAAAGEDAKSKDAERERLLGVLEQKDALLRDLGEQLPPLEQRISRLADMLAKGKSVIGEQAAVIAQLEPLRGLPDVLAEKDRMLQNLHGQLAPLEERLTTLVGLLEAGKAHAEQQASTIAALTTELEALRRVHSEREETLKRIQDEQLDASLLHAQESKEQADTIVALKGEHATLETRLADVDAAKRRLADEHRDRAVVVSELEHKLADKASLVDRLRGSIAPLEQGIVLLRGKLAEQNALVDQTRDAIPPLQRRIAEQDRHTRQLEDQLKAKEAAVAALTTEIESLRGLPQMLADEKARAEQLLSSMHEYERRVRQLSENLEPLRELPQKLADEKARAAQLVASIHDLEARIVEQDRHTRHLEETIATRTAELDSLRSLPQKLSEERTLVVQLRASLQPLEQRVSKLDRQLKVKNDSIANLRQQSTLVDQLERRLQEQELEINRLEEHLDAGRVLAKTVEEQAQKIVTLTRDLEQQRERLRDAETKTVGLTAEVEKLRPLQDEVQLLRDREKEQAGVIATLTADLEPLRSSASRARELQVLVEDLRGSELGSRDVFIEHTPRQSDSRQRLADGARTPTPRRQQESDTESEVSARQQLEDKIWQQEARLRDLRDALARAESKLVTHKDYGNILQRKLRSVELKLATMQSTSAEREAKLASELRDTRQQLESASATASVASLPSSVGDDTNEKDIVTMFDDITNAVYEFSRRVSRKLYRGRREIVMHPHAWALKQVDEDLFQYLRPFLEHSAAATTTVPEAVASTTQAVLHWLLFITVFASFMPLQFSQSDDRLGAFLLQLQQNIQSDVPQEQGARWRAITYKSLKKGRDDATLVPAISKYMFDTLVLGLAIFRDRASVASHLRELWSDVSRIVRMALEWQDHARSSHFAYDYSAFLPKVRATYVDDEMETPDGPVRPGPPSGPRTVMLPLSMGLMASRTETVDEDLARVNRVLKKAHILVAL